VGATRRSPHWAGVLTGIAFGLLGPAVAWAQSSGGSVGVASADAEKPSIGRSISEGFKTGVEKFAGALGPKKAVKPAEDPLSLSTKAEPSARLFVALARLQEQEGRLAAAAERYEKALKVEPNYPGALLGYARLKERLGHPAEAEKLYQKAAKAHPREPAVMNNMGLFYAKQSRFSKALAALGRAASLKPRGAKYRHNLAVVLVQMGRPQEAFGHLRSVHTEAVAHYNLGYLLKTKGDDRAAAQHFGEALRADPSMAAARFWLANPDEGPHRAQRDAQAPSSPAPPKPRHAPAPPRLKLGVGSAPPPAESPASPRYGAERPSDRAPGIRFIPPPPRRPAPGPGAVPPELRGPQLGSPAVPQAPAPPRRVDTPPSAGAAPMPSGPRAPLPGRGLEPTGPNDPPLPPASHRPPPVRRLPSVN